MNKCAHWIIFFRRRRYRSSCSGRW